MGKAITYPSVRIPGAGSFISVGSVITAAIGPADADDIYGDKDWFQVTLTAGHSYHFAATAGVSAADTLDAVAIRVYNFAGTKVSSLGDGANPGLDFSPTISGKYYLAVSAGGDGAWQTKTGDYQVSLSDFAVSPVSDNDMVREGTDTKTLLPVEGQLMGAINADPMTGDDVGLAGVDKDWYQVTLKADHAYHFGASATVNGSDTLDAVAIRVFDSSGAPVTSLADNANPTLDFKPVSDGTYYLAISAGGAGDWQSKTGNFEVWLEDKGIPPVMPAVSGDYDLANGKLWSLLVDCSIAAYGDTAGQHARDNLKESGWQPVDLPGVDDSGRYTSKTLIADVGAFVTYSGHTAVISFEGTNPKWEEWEDWANDAVGMFPAVQALVPLIDAFDKFVATNQITQVYVTGHSLGGALAQAYMMAHPDGSGADNWSGVNYDAVTFASPGFNFGLDMGFLSQWPESYAIPESSLMSNMPLSKASVHPDHRFIQFEIDGDPVPDLVEYPVTGVFLLQNGDTIHLDCVGTGTWGFGLHNKEIYADAVKLLDNAVKERDFPEDPNDTHVLISVAGSATLTDNDPLVTTEYIVGGTGNDILSGTGKNTLYGGAGNDTYTVDRSDDVIVEANRNGSDAGGWDTVTAKASYTLQNNVEALYLAKDTGRIPGDWDWFDEPFAGTGNSQNNWIEGNDAANVLSGLGGNDTLWGNDGDDTLWGGEGNDTLGGGQGDDYLAGGAGDDVYRYWLSDEDERVFDDGGNDQFWFENISLTQIVGMIQANTDHLVITIETPWSVGNWANDTITIEGWYAGSSAYRIETFQIEDLVLSDTQFVNVVQQSLNGGGIVVIPFSAARSSSAPELAFASLALESPTEGAVPGLVGSDTDEFFFGSEAAETVDLAGGNDRLYGRGGDDILAGGSGNDWLDGGIGADTLIGGSGNDTYVVDNADDVLSELDGEGIDSARIAIGSATSYRIGDHIENATIISTAAINLIGNAEANLLTGNDAANFLDGGAGNDTLIGQAGDDRLSGGTGDDSYHVNLVRDAWSNLARLEDVVMEGAGQGSDTIILETAQSATLDSQLTTLTLGANLETLDASLTGASRLNLTGNAFDNTLIGNAAANVLAGGAGTDSFVGGLGDDTYVIDSPDELATITENAGEGNDTLQIAFANSSATVAQTIALGSALGSIENITIAETVKVGVFGQFTKSAPSGLFNLVGSNFDNVLTGNGSTNVLDGGAGNDTLAGLAGGDTLNGGIGNDLLEGGAGGDFLSGGAGDDRFVFTSKLTGDADRIIDFTEGDLLVLEGSVFAGLGTGGALTLGAFVQGTVAMTANQHLLYDGAQGYLYYDADGSGVGAKVLVANLTNHAALDAGDFWVA